ncbi:SDR family oxidoreductase [Streptomyces sp. Go40/10]|uniref:1-cyclohexenylcarbonyl-CoA reductase n=1 Tax=Streptomyces collinus TaxID=42684 RepID=CHCA_STRCU|nr:SDR family oxidoreductase [Streptomyces sp. Go40/10]P95727.1 RecName: Full=1-cyclohexenylcarbonyl-CoA reductase; AltName: Full=Cyclohexane-1-carbonyl-CoA reductase (NADP(+)) [Streptomyces collinus]AAC44655.1 1-cyclohexenylcarbonyl CoA reductase [Streptomyces collinus]UFR06952.1 SDR family oxidoreductase [Streptomyces sp. Go40/10]
MNSPHQQQTADRRQVSLITGASRGIGRTLALTLARRGGTVVVNYKKNADLAQKTVAEVEEAGGQGFAVQADVETTEGVTALFDEVAQRCGRLDHFVSNAAASAFKNIVDLGPHHLDRSYAMNLRPFVLGAQQAVKLMDNGGRIVALSSYGSVRAYPTYAMLGGMKAAIESWVRYMAVEFAPYGINVNAVNGGLIDSDSLEFFYNVEGMPPMQGVLDRIPARRPGTVQEMADTIAFLLGDGAGYITGQTLVVDGGLSIVAPPFFADAGEALELPPRPTRDA